MTSPARHELSSESSDQSLKSSRVPNNPEDLLHNALFPDDSYAADGTYFADLPTVQRNRWIAEQSTQEAKRELGIIWAMFKKDPLSPVSSYFHNNVVAGLGFFTEGYVLFSVGNVRTLFEAAFPTCWKTFEICNKVWVQSVSYLEIVGIILGQIMIGVLGDWMGRRWGMVQDAATMCLGAILLTAVWGAGGSQYGWVIGFAWSLLIFGVGVGGEYPMTSTTAMEGVHGATSARNDKLHRGRSVLLAFLMQGWGQLINQGVLIILLLVFHNGLTPPYDHSVAQFTYRVSFGFIVVFLLLLIYIRVWRLPNIDQASKSSKAKSAVTGYDVQSLRLVSSHYWHRLFATSLCWFCNDAPFYGSQIFRSVFLSIVTSSSDQVNVIWMYNLINVGCELCGYYLAAFLIDNKHYGRKRMQAVGFMMVFILYIIAAALYPELNKKGAGGKAFLFIYYFSSFWIQFGSNSTTFLLAAEIYPSPVRATAHGVSAATGKLGALFSTVLYNYIGGRTKFWVVSWFGLIGFILTIVFIPDTTGLDLREQERYWECVRKGRASDYHGIAIHPRHLSLFERYVLHRNAAYDPELDRQAKINELRALHEEMARNIGNEKPGRDAASSSNTSLDSDVSAYFDWEKQSKGEKAL